MQERRPAAKLGDTDINSFAPGRGSYGKQVCESGIRLTTP